MIEKVICSPQEAGIDSFDKVKDRVYVCLRNRGYQDIENCVKEHFAGDIWKTYYVRFPDLGGMGATVRVTDWMLKLWNVTVDDLERCAVENGDAEADVMSIGSALGMDDDGCSRTYVITNKPRYCGASAIMDSDVQGFLEKEFGGKCYILPSSIHEVLAVSADMDAKDLARMVRDINSSIVDDGDRLSNHVFVLSGGVLQVVA